MITRIWENSKCAKMAVTEQDLKGNAVCDICVYTCRIYFMRSHMQAILGPLGAIKKLWWKFFLTLCWDDLRGSSRYIDYRCIWFTDYRLLHNSRQFTCTFRRGNRRTCSAKETYQSIVIILGNLSRPIVTYRDNSIGCSWKHI